MKIKQIVLGSITVTLIIIVSSTLINGLLFGEIYSGHKFVRDTNSWHYFPGMAMATLFWGVIITTVFYLVQPAIPGKYIGKGLNYGLILWFLYAYLAELFTYLLYHIPFSFVLIGWLFHLIVLPVCGMTLAYIFLEKSRSPENPSAQMGLPK